VLWVTLAVPVLLRVSLWLGVAVGSVVSEALGVPVPLSEVCCVRLCV